MGRGCCLIIVIGALVQCVQAGEAGKVRFNRDIRPILTENCLACHGPDAGHRKAEAKITRSGRPSAARAGSTPGQASLRTSPEALSKALSGFTDEHQKLIFRYANYDDTLPFGFASKDVHGHLAWNEERLWQLLFVRLSFLQQAFGFHSCRFGRARWNQPRTQNEAACRIHERYQVEVTVCCCRDWSIVESENNPGFVDVKLAWMKCVCSHGEA